MASSSWSKMGAGTPAISSMALRETFWKYHTRLTSHWPELNHVTTSGAREAGIYSLLVGLIAVQLEIVLFLRRI